MSNENKSQIEAAARYLFGPGDVVEVRVPKALKFRTISGYFDDFGLMAEAAAALDREGCYPGIYWTLNPVDPALLARAANRTKRYVGADGTTGDKHVVRRRLLLVDLDPERPSDISATDVEHDAALAKLRLVHDALLAEGWPEALQADSGNGGHLVYRIDLPNDKDAADLVQRCLQALALRFEDGEGARPRIKVDRTVFNASRISAIYGTVKRKGDHTADRPHRLSHILNVPALLAPVPLELLRQLGDRAPSKEGPRRPPAPPTSILSHRGPGRSEFSLRQFLDEHGIAYRDPVAHDGGYKFTLLECPFDASHKGKDAAVFERSDGYGFKCFHNSCSGNGWREFRQLLDPGAYSQQHFNHDVSSRRSAGRQEPTRNPAPPQEDAGDSPLPVPDFGEPEGEEQINEEDVRAAVAKAIEDDDIDAALVLIPEIAKLAPLAVLRIKTDLAGKFKRKFSPKGFEQAIRDERRRAIAGFWREDTGLPTIIVNNRPMRDVVGDSLAALRASNDPPVLFVRSGELVFVEIDERERPGIKAVEKAHLRGRLDRAANYIRRGAEADIAVPPPLEVVEDLMALPSVQWGVPPLEFVVEVPTLRPDGTVLGTPGYDPISRMLYAPAADFHMEPIPDVIDSVELEFAVDMLHDAICDFPFADTEPGSSTEYADGNPNRANMIGLLLTPIVRPAIKGVVPLALIDAPQAGTGKSLLADLFATVTTGRPAAMMPFPRNEEEMAKSIGSTLLDGKSLVCFDNVEGILQSPTLALVLTAKDYQARILGVSENMIAPNRATWLATGNNIRPAGDMVRRCYHIRLDAKKSRPYQGRKFRHPNILDWASEMRPRLLRSLLVISRAWYQRPNRPQVEDAWGSFEDWHRTIAGILGAAGINGFLANLQKFLAEADDNALQWEAFLADIESCYGYAWFTTGKIVAQIREATPLAPAPFTVPDSLGDVDRRKEGSMERAMGKSFSKRLGMRFGERELYLDRTTDDHSKQANWRVLTPQTEAEARKADPVRKGKTQTF